MNDQLHTVNPFIGRGEKTAKTILETVFPSAIMYTQVPIIQMISTSVYDFYDPVHQKSSVDIVMEWRNKVYGIRIQDKHHTGAISSRKDSIQRKDMEDNGVIVIDIFEREAPNLFKNTLNYKSYLEVLLPMQKAMENKVR